jgi:excisionase family DNA binding protein
VERLAYSLAEAAEVVGVSLPTLRRAIDKGDIVPRYPSRRPVIPAAELQQWLDRLPTEAPEAT